MLLGSGQHPALPAPFSSEQNQKGRGGKLATKEALVAKMCFRGTFTGSLWTALVKI